MRRRTAAGAAGPEIVTFGESANADVRIAGSSFAGTGSSFELRRRGCRGPS